MIGFFKRLGKTTYNYRIHLHGTTIDVLKCKDLELHTQNGKVMKYTFTWHSPEDTAKYSPRVIDIDAITAIEKI